MLLRLLAALLVGLPLGAWSAWSAIRGDIGWSALTVAEWTAWPLEGSPAADPYTKAKVASQGAVPLGVGEGVAFEARSDAAGRPLDLGCNYRLAGRTPKARIWTLTAHGPNEDGANGAALVRPDGAVAALTSRDLVRAETGAFAVTVGARAAAGDWLPLVAPPPPARPRRADEPAPRHPFRLVLRFYDSPVATSAELFEPTMPRVERLNCAA